MGASQSPPDGSYSLYAYDPNESAANVFYVFFFLLALKHTQHTYQFKSWRFTGLLTWGAIIYMAGFIVRYISIRNPENLGLFIASTVLLYCAPPVFAAANYFTFGRTLLYIPYLSPIHPGRVVSTFVGLDIFVEILTAQGASRLAQWDQPEQVQIGLSLIKASLLLQIALFCGFIALQVVFHLRCLRANVLSDNIRGILYVLYASNMLILFRSIYRIVDNFMGSTGYTETHEWCIYVLDALPILANSFILNVYHPAMFLPRSGNVFLSQDGSTERKGPGWHDKRNTIVTILDPFDLAGLIRGTDHKTRFWDNEERYDIVSVEERNALKPCQDSRPLMSRIVDPCNLAGLIATSRARRGRS